MKEDNRSIGIKVFDSNVGTELYSIYKDNKEKYRNKLQDNKYKIMQDKMKDSIIEEVKKTARTSIEKSILQIFQK